MRQTTNYNMKLPEGSDKIDIDAISSNFEKIDTLLNQAMSSSGEGGESSPFEGMPKTTSALGGLESGSDINGMDVKEVLSKMLFPYVKPEITLTLTPSTTLYKIGETVNNLKVAVKATDKSNLITNVTVNVGSEKIIEKAASGSYDATYNKAITTDTTITATATDNTETATATKKIEFINPMYAGTTSNIKEILQKKGTYALSNITCSSESIVFKYPASYGDLGKAIDINNFDITGTFTKTTEQLNGVEYNVYTNKPSTLNGFKVTFQF